MMKQLTLWCLSLLSLMGACKSDSPATSISVKNTLKPEAFDELILSPKPLIATVKCLDSTVKSPGTRSEQAWMKVKLLSPGLGEEPQGKELVLLRYTQGEPCLKPGEQYLVVAYEEWEGHYTLSGWKPVDKETAASSLSDAVSLYKQRKKASRP